ncbi:uncharacterized protein [Chironomus tepperi]|uniref:uncharacterized protein isoform X2 n=1 Tax=Chironomus tepperi TaxID=113505 RepID=UPI00391F9F85
MKRAAFEVALRKDVSPNEVQYMSDVTFVLENGNELFKAHQMFLMTASPIIQKLLTENNNKQLNIKIDQITKSIMLEICRYAYTDDVKFTDENKFDILFAAMKFEMKNLIEKTIDAICKQLSDKTVFKTLELNKKFNNLKINLKSFEYIEKNHQTCFKNSEFLKISEDLLRILMETCKIPGESAANYVKMWTKANNSDDLNELLALINLKEPSDNEGSDAESVASSKVSESSRNIRGRRQRRYGRNPKKSRQTSSYTVSHFHVPGTNMQHSGMKCFKLIGNIMRKNYKYANLDFSAKVNNVFLYALEFVYDLSTTDKEFEISVYQVENNQRKNLYTEKFTINTGSTLVGYKFGREIEILAFQKIWIKIEFPKQEYRLTFDKFGELQQPLGSDLMLRKDSECNSYSQIIAAIHYITR